MAAGVVGLAQPASAVTVMVNSMTVASLRQMPAASGRTSCRSCCLRARWRFAVSAETAYGGDDRRLCMSRHPSPSPARGGFAAGFALVCCGVL